MNKHEKALHMIFNIVLRDISRIKNLGVGKELSQASVNNLVKYAGILTVFTDKKERTKLQAKKAYAKLTDAELLSKFTDEMAPEDMPSDAPETETKPKKKKDTQ